jgi:two-component system, OmpR family, response regulator
MDLLLIEDDAVLGRAIQQGLTESGHQCTWVRDGQKGCHEAVSPRFDAVILDLMLPNLPGMEILRRMRSEGVQTPVLMLSPRLGRRPSRWIECRGG